MLHRLRLHSESFTQLLARNVSDLSITVLKQFDLEHLHDGLLVLFIRLLLPLAAWLQELADAGNSGHPALERLEGNIESCPVSYDSLTTFNK